MISRSLWRSMQSLQDLHMHMLPEPEADRELRAEPDRKLRLTGKRKKAPAHVAEESNECVLIVGPHWI